MMEQYTLPKNRIQVQNANHLLLLQLFCVSLLMNYFNFYGNRFLILLGMGLLVLSISYYKNWIVSAFGILITALFYAFLFPRMANHSNLEFFISLGFLGVFVLKVFRTKFVIDPNLLSWIFRITAVCIYFYTGFHKLNTAFLNPCVSCVNQINEQLIFNFTGQTIPLSASFSRLFQYGSLFLELLVPFGLLIASTRKWSAILLLFFHFYLSFTVFSDFGSFALFLIIGCLIDFNKPYKIKYWTKKISIYAIIALISIGTKLLLIHFRMDSNRINFIQGVIFNGAYIFFCIAFFKQYSKVQTPFSKSFIPIFFSLILFFSIWALKSYVGLGTSSNLTMFSNLNTESSLSNHLLIDTKNTKIFPFEEDKILILKLDEKLHQDELEGFLLPKVEFKYRANQWCKGFPNEKISCTVVYKKDTLVIPDLRSTSFNTTKWWYKYLYFRKIQPNGATKCYW